MTAALAPVHPTANGPVRVVRDAAASTVRSGGRRLRLTTRADAKDVLKEMKELVRAQVVQPIVWETARRVVAKVTPRAESDQAQVIRQWCSLRWRFINDPLWYQNLAGNAPVYLLGKLREQGYVQGNCAGAAMLSAALCNAIHIPCRFIGVAFDDKSAPYSHVFAVAYPRVAGGGRAAVEMDFTRPAAAKRPNFSRRLVADVPAGAR